jgi:hypothetical protein
MYLQRGSLPFSHKNNLEEEEDMAHNVSGNWQIVQSNGYKVNVSINQPVEVSVEPPPVGEFRLLTDGALTGTADEITPRGTDVSQQNPVTGQLAGDSFEILVDWRNGTKGQYSGTFDPAGNLAGVTFDVDHPGSQATWHRA